jgi:hypothetical protein
MAEPKAFSPAKLICGIIAGEESFFQIAEARLSRLFGLVDAESLFFPFDVTDYYEKQMGMNLKRKFISFKKLMRPEKLSRIKLVTNRLEDDIRDELGTPHRIVNIDPGYVIPSALIMATAKNFAHRIPLQHGIYAHLEFLFGRNEVRPLAWTYPDFMSEGYQNFFLEVRRIYLSQVKKKPGY